VKGNPFSGLKPLPLIGLYSVVLHWTYQTQIAPLFGYLGSRYRSPDPINYLLAGALLLVLTWVMPTKLRRVSDFVLWMLFLMVAVPAILVPQFAAILSRDQSLILALVVAANFLLLTALTRLSPSAINLRIVTDSSLLWAAVFALSVGFYVFLLVTTGLQFRSIQGLNSVRDIRFEYRDQITTIGAALGYLVRLQGNVLNPLIIAKGIYGRNWTLTAAGFVGQLLIFGLTGYKLVLLSAPALLLVALMYRYSRRRTGSLIPIGVLLTALIAIGVDRLRGGAITFTELFIDRLLLVPGTLTAAHVLVFDHAEKMRWSYSFMSPFFDNPYGTTPAFVVGKQFTGSDQTTASANLFADGFANLGWAGMTVETLLLVVLLWLVDGASRHLPLPVSSALMLVPVLALVNGSVFTSILTGGIGAVIVLMAMLPGDGWSGRDSKAHSNARERRRQPALTRR